MNNDVNGSNANKKFDKSFLIGFIVCFVINVLIALIIGLIQIYVLNRSLQDNCLLILTDSFTMSGLLMCLYYLIVFVSDEGAFDIISYSVQLVWNVTFHKNVRETNLPSTFAEYKQMKRAKPRLNLRFVLFSGLLFFIIGLIIMFIYYSNF